MTPSIVFRILFLVVSLVIGAAVVHAEDTRAVRARMEQRLGSVDSLKAKKLVGENNRGFLEARASLAPADEKIVADENEDRRTVYAAIAAQQCVSAEEVGRARAQKIAIASKRGVMIQAPDGSWSEKS